MIALRPLNGKIGKAPWSVREHMEIPLRILKILDVEALKKAKTIAESPKSKSKETKKVND